MNGYITNLEAETKKNTDFRRVLYTSKYSQLVLMSLKAGEGLEAEIHEDHDQFFRFEAGEGKVIINHVEHRVKDGNGVVVPAGALHEVVNTSKSSALRFYTIYSPANHRDGVVHHTKAIALADDEHFDGKTSE